MLPKDPAILLSYVNTQLRDNCSDLDDFCKREGVEPEAVAAALAALDYRYDPKQNRFV